MPSVLTSESQVRDSERQAVRALWRRIVPAALAGLFLAELFVMRLFDLLGWHEGLVVGLMDAALLALLVLPGLYLVVLRPVTRLAAQLAAATADARFRGVVEAASDAILIGDRSGRIRFANPAALELLGFSAGELDGAEIALLVPEALRARHVEGMRRYLETGEARVVGQGPVQMEARAKDGQHIPVEITLSAPTLRKEGLLVAVVRDLRQRQRLALYEAILPTCCVCGRIRDDIGVERGSGHWDKLESYVQRHSPARLSHTWCPECMGEYRRKQGLPPRPEGTPTQIA